MNLIIKVKLHFSVQLRALSQKAFSYYRRGNCSKQKSASRASWPRNFFKGGASETKRTQWLIFGNRELEKRRHRTNQKPITYQVS